MGVAVMIFQQVPSSTLAVEMIAQWARDHRLDFQIGAGGSGAVLSACGHYRYLLWRNSFTGAPFQAFAMLNPSTADHAADDPTIRRCIGFTPPGMTGPLVWNLFAFRATSPADMKASGDPVGPLNDSAIDLALRLSACTIAAWGTHGSHRGRDRDVLRRCAAEGAQLHALKLTSGGHPGHPLYLPAASAAQPWEYDW